MFNIVAVRVVASFSIYVDQRFLYLILFYYFLKTVTARIPNTTTNTIKIKKMILAIEAAPAAIPVNPKIAATIAINRKIAVHLSITYIIKLIIY